MLNFYRVRVLGRPLGAVNYYNKELHLGCCSSPRSASGPVFHEKLRSTFLFLFSGKALGNFRIFDSVVMQTVTGQIPEKNFK